MEVFKQSLNKTTQWTSYPRRLEYRPLSPHQLGDSVKGFQEIISFELVPSEVGLETPVGEAAEVLRPHALLPSTPPPPPFSFRLIFHFRSLKYIYISLKRFYIICCKQMRYKYLKSRKENACLSGRKLEEKREDGVVGGKK